VIFPSSVVAEGGTDSVVVPFARGVIKTTVAGAICVVQEARPARNPFTPSRATVTWILFFGLSLNAIADLDELTHHCFSFFGEVLNGYM
jgi:hypothetical protein